MAIEGLPTASPAPASGPANAPGPAAGAAPPVAASGNASGGKAAPANSAAPTPAAGAPGAGTGEPGSDKTEFMKILEGAAGLATIAAGSAAPTSADKPADTKGDDAPDDEIGFEDLSEFLSQVLVPGANVPAAPATNSDTTVEIDFTQDSSGDNAKLSLETLAALTASAQGKTASATAQDRFASAVATTANPVFSVDTSLLKDALAAENGKAFDPSSTAADPSVDLDGAGLTSFSPLHAAALHSAHSGSQTSMQMEVRSAMGTQAWADEVGGHLTWMASHGRESASLTLSPEHLGPIEVRISTQDGQTSVWFGAQNADTRAAIEQALPRLRELFSAQGLSLADSGVFREAPRQQQQGSAPGANGGSGGDEVAVVTSVGKRGNGMLDLYA